MTPTYASVMQYKHSSTAKIGIHAENVQGPIYRVGQNGQKKM